MEKAFKIPRWHELHSDYFRYLRNVEDTTRILTKFRKKHGIECEWFTAGTHERTGKPFLYIGTHVDVQRIIHDKAKFGTDLLKPDKYGRYAVRKNSALYKDWIETLCCEDNFKVLDEPKISTYIAIDNKGKDLGKFEREFLVKDGELYLDIRSEEKFIVTDDFIEIELYRFYDMKEEQK